MFDNIGVAMSFNYRVRYPELCMVHAMTDDIVNRVMDVVVDVSSLEVLTDKKKDSASDELNTTDGEPEDSPGTYQPSLIS